MNTGHVEKTNDRDYEVEERYRSRIWRIERKSYIFGRELLLKVLHLGTGGTVPWSRQRTDYKRKRRDTWTRYEVGKPLGLPDYRRQTCWPRNSAMTASQMRIAETIDAFYGDAGANDGVSRSYKQAVEDLDAETIKALDGPFR